MLGKQECTFLEETHRLDKTIQKSTHYRVLNGHGWLRISLQGTLDLPYPTITVLNKKLMLFLMTLIDFYI